jgi:hypothetical protein
MGFGIIAMKCVINNHYIELVVSVVMGVLLYFVTNLVFKNSVFMEFFHIIFNRIRKYK